MKKKPDMSLENHTQIQAKKSFIILNGLVFILTTSKQNCKNHAKKEVLYQIYSNNHVSEYLLRNSCF